ncbi:MAG: TRAP transporter large permease subunit [Alphaproteobacteria bacterium]|nr:TRAP transporter large permease subunit [Alphaproteobacteria bacterium]
MSFETIGLLSIAVLVLLLLLRVPIAISLGMVSFGGIWLMLGFTPAWGILSAVTYKFAATWTLSAIPMFLMMGYVCYHAGLTKGVFAACRIWLVRLPGGVAVASVFASAGFASVTGSSIACAAAMGRIAIPEMIRFNYAPSLATGSVAAAGTLGALIPPSVLLILFGIFAEVNIGKLFLGGIGIGLLTAVAYAAMIIIRVKLNPELAPPVTETHSFREKIEVLRPTWPLGSIVVIILGGMFTGLFTATEAGAIGAASAILVALFNRSLTWKVLYDSTIETLTTTGTLFIIAIGANLLTRLLSLSGTQDLFTTAIIGFQADPLFLLIGITIVYLILGMFLEPIGAMLLTLPVFLPILGEAGIGLVFFGVYLAKLLEIGMITPPIGINVFVIKGVVGDLVSLTDIFRGIMWFLLADLVVIVLVIAFPEIITFLPETLLD